MPHDDYVGAWRNGKWVSLRKATPPPEREPVHVELVSHPNIDLYSYGHEVEDVDDYSKWPIWKRERYGVDAA